jgi:two-component system OmpR family response regulator
MRILLVEDQANLARQVAARVARAGYELDHVTSLEEAIHALGNCAYALALLDRRLPDGDSLTLIPLARRTQPQIRIVMLTALDTVDDRVEGLEAGADDYLTKPFHFDEMVARIRVQLRKHGDDHAPPIEIGALVLDPRRRVVTVRGKPILFARRELLLLEILLRRANCVVTREALNAELYGYGEEVQEHALTSIVSRVRTRLAELDAGVEIHSARLIGYILRRIAADEEP